MARIARKTETTETFEQIDARIRRVFTVLSKVSHGVVLGHIKAAIVSGAPGCGKSHSLEQALTAAEGTGTIRYTSMKGACSAIGLYKMLFECSEPGSVLLIDDCDDVFSDESSLNLLKACLDTGKTRRVHWNKESKALENEGVPRNFEFNGAVIFITNIDFAHEISKQNKMAPHYNALLSRSLYVDLRIHSKMEILVRVQQVVFENEFLHDNDINRKQAQEMVDWLTSNVNHLRCLSIRTVIQMAAFIKTDRDWRVMAEALLLNT